MQTASHKKLTVYDYLFLLLLVVAILVQAENFHYPLGEAAGEPSRDYFVASHLFSDGELPLRGPNAGFMSGLYNSPAYYYLLKIILLFHDDFFFLSYVNFVVQIFVIILVYVTTRVGFDQPAPLLAAGLFAFSQQVMERSVHVGQAPLMASMVSIGYLLFLLAYQRKRYIYLLASMGFFVVASALHLSALALLPLILIFTVLILRTWFADWRYYLGVGAMVMTCFLLLFGTTIQFYSHAPLQLQTITIKHFCIQFFHTFVGLFPKLFIMLAQPFHTSYTLFATFILAGLYLWFGPSTNQKVLFLAVGGFILQPLIFLAVGRGLSPEPLALGDQQLTSIVGLLAIFVAVPISQLLLRNKSIAIAAVIAFFYIVIFPITERAYASFTNETKNDNFLSLTLAARAIERTVHDLSIQEHRPNPAFFNINVYRTGSFGTSEMLLWNVLQENMHYQFVRVTRDGYRILGGDDYIFLICLEHRQPFPADECLDAFYAGNGVPQDRLESHREYQEGYSNEGQIYDTKPFTIFLLKKKSVLL